MSTKGSYLFIIMLSTKLMYSQVEYGQLSACFIETKQLGEYCILQRYERVLCGARDEQLTNEKECLLLFRTKALAVIPATSICTAVSIVHECGQSCSFQQGQKSWTAERESITRSGLQLIHDNSNTLFCVNIYCMKCLNS